jgi:inosose dehydratase
MVTRREVLKALSVSAPVSMSYVASGFSWKAEAAGSMRYGYAAITWGNAVTQAIDDIAAIGYRGIQLRTADGTLARYGEKPSALSELLESRRLTLVALSSGNLSIDPARERDEIATHVGHARFVRAVGGLYLQVIDERPKGRVIAAADYRRLGRLMTEVGKRTADLGVPLVYHHHMNSLGEKPPEVAAVLDAADRRYVRLLFDIAHYQQAGGDPAQGLRQYREWLQLIHLKDVRDAAGGYQFVELGRGRVDMPGVFAALREVGYNGWAVVELDRAPDAGRSAKDCAAINKRYLVDVMKQTI